MSSFADLILDYCPQAPDDLKYVNTHLGRLSKTLELTPPGGPDDAVLEMGAYMHMTPALAQLGYGEVRGCHLGPLGKVDDKTATAKNGEVFRCKVDLFNAETDEYPYEDGRFKAVVCAEVIEHLAEDPMYLMAEVNRILEPGGYLVLSTPNITSLRSCAGVLSGYHPALFQEFTTRIGGNAVEPRHAREYAPREIGLLMEGSGFEVEALETTPTGLERNPKFDWVQEVIERYAVEHELPLGLRDDVIHCRARKTGPVKERYPRWLYL